MVMETTVTVKVIRGRVRLCKVVFSSGHHIVVGGRLLCTSTDEGVRNYPDMPEYRMEDFPVDTEKYVDGATGRDEVQVLVLDDGQMRPVGPVRACAMLFTHHDPEEVRRWLKEEAAK